MGALGAAWFSSTKIDRFGVVVRPIASGMRIGDAVAVGTKAERWAARERVSSYYEAQLAALLEHVASAIDGLRAGKLDVHEVDDVIHHYKRAARELWKFCWARGVGAHILSVTQIVDELDTDGEPIDWWQQGARRRRDDPPANA